MNKTDLTMNMPFERFKHLKNKIRNKYYSSNSLTPEEDQQLAEQTRDQLVELLKKDLIDLKAKLKKEARSAMSNEEVQ